MKRMLACACAVALALPSGAYAISDADWVKRVYNDVLFRDPTTPELNSALDKLAVGGFGGPEVQRLLRWSTAGTVFASDEYRRDLIGANGAIAGYFQMLLGRNPTVQEATEIANFLAARTDEFVIENFIDDGFSDEYRARALANNPAFAGCVGGEMVVNQVYLDLLGRNATRDELAQTMTQAAQAILYAPPFISSPNNIEYRQRLVRAAFMRYLHREPRTAPGTDPDHNLSELDYYTGVLGGLLVSSDEDFYAYLVSSPEYGAGITLAMPPVSTSPPAAGNLVVNLASPSDASARLSIAQSLPPLFLGPVLTASNQSVLTLSAQSAVQETEINALVVEQFGGAVTADAAVTLLMGAAQKIDDVSLQVLSCPLTFECFAGTAAGTSSTSAVSKQLQHAQVNLQLGYDALASGDFAQAARDARRAYDDAVQAAKKASR